ncbi:MAG: hypothetical protein JST75_20520 [Bacteroidetes bacterium]|nr:hypothetical protein [Bacteroidota bacterium]
MAIIINHRFIDRLTSTDNYDKIHIIIVGTFNPGLPDISKLNATEKIQFDEIEKSRKFKKFNQVRNFYDRPQNRFWKVMDFLNDNDFYTKNNINSRNHNGLKFYVGMDRDKVFKKQCDFCLKNKILITDIAMTIKPVSFCDIYDNFPDTAIEKASPIWNTDNIIKVIHDYNPKKVLINFKADSKSTPNICSEISKITKRFPDKLIPSLKSTSGAAGYKYHELIENWKGHFL